MEKVVPEKSSADHQDRKPALGAVLRVLFAVGLMMVLFVLGFTLVGYGLFALFKWIAGQI